jgi:hypothetical protein
VVIGGTSLSGGQGSIVGTVIGTLITGILTNMLRLNNVDSNTELMLKAVIIVAAGVDGTEIMIMRRVFLVACAAALVSCGSGGAKKYFIAFSQCNNAEPYRAAQNELLTRLVAKSPTCGSASPTGSRIVANRSRKSKR